jgi:hypothetical protein
MARYEHLPIYKAALDMAVHMEKVAASFSRAHRYTLGNELRTLAHRSVMLTIKANNEVAKKPILKELSAVLDEIKISIHIAKEIKAFHSFRSFEVCIRNVDSVARQCQGWLGSQSK